MQVTKTQFMSADKKGGDFGEEGGWCPSQSRKNARVQAS